MQIQIKSDAEVLGNIIQQAVNDLDTPKPLTEAMIYEVVSAAVHDAFTLGTISEREMYR